MTLTLEKMMEKETVLELNGFLIKRVSGKMLWLRSPAGEATLIEQHKVFGMLTYLFEQEILK